MRRRPQSGVTIIRPQRHREPRRCSLFTILLIVLCIGLFLAPENLEYLLRMVSIVALVVLYAIFVIGIWGISAIEAGAKPSIEIMRRSGSGVRLSLRSRIARVIDEPRHLNPATAARLTRASKSRRG